jgi:hypothetical protein
MKRSYSWWLTPVIPATQEAEVRRITVRSQPRANSCETVAQKRKKNPSLKRADGVAQGEGPEFKHQYHKKKKKKNPEVRNMLCC